MPKSRSNSSPTIGAAKRRRVVRGGKFRVTGANNPQTRSWGLLERFSSGSLHANEQVLHIPGPRGPGILTRVALAMASFFTRQKRGR